MGPGCFEFRIDGIGNARRPYMRDGGKPAAAVLLKPVTQRKRKLFLLWFLEIESGRTIGAAMTEFHMTRSNVRTYWTTLNREHGIGYSLSENVITPILPHGVSESAIFGGTNGT